ncbi:thiamine phosphate synthase [bacterium]|nr:thiamine phosphate synthase [bacterium]
MRIEDGFGLYLVMTDPAAGYAKCAEAAVRRGVRFVQLRMKKASKEEIMREAKEVRAVTKGTDTLFILNDDPELAVRCEADGVHLGQGDMPLPIARKLCPELKVFGLSTHNLGQVTEAAKLAPDYIGVGPVYATPTKAIPDPTLGIDGAAEMIKAAPFPAVAIGGINHENLPLIKRAGARNFSVVRAVCQNNDPESAIRRLQEIWATADK